MNESTIRQWYQHFKGGNELVEIRIFDPNSKQPYSGYFTDIESILAEIRKYDHCNICYTLNRIDDACYSREQHDRIVRKPKSTTSDNDITRREWCLIDIDVEKPSDTNSTDEEKAHAHGVAIDVYKFLVERGFPKPTVCDSANGYHILIRMDEPSTKEVTDTIKRFLRALDMLFSTEKAKIDVSTFNASRVCKVPGCISRKGSDTSERPQRESKMLNTPQGTETANIALFSKVAELLPTQEQKVRYNANLSVNRQTFDLEEFIQKYNIEISRVVTTAQYKKYVLAQCPFDPNHKAPDSAVFAMPDGSYGFKCLHNSCSSYTFRDFRLHFDPHAYDNERQYDENRTQQGYRSQYQQSMQAIKEKYEVKKEEDKNIGKKWFSLKDVEKLDVTQLDFVKTGFHDIDKSIMGLIFGETSIVSGSNSSGKSSWLNNIIINAREQGVKSALWSGELRPDILKGWILQMAAGHDNVRPSKFDDKYFVPTSIAEKIDEWFDGYFYLYNNEYGCKWEQIFNDMNDMVGKGVKLFILDNLFSLDIDIFNGDKNNKQKELVMQICKYAKEKNVHIILVAHPRKSIAFLRKDDISGTSDISNAVDNVFIVHRVNNDFVKRGGEFLGQENIGQYSFFGNVVEICKNRMFGKVDVMCGMYYDIPSRRFLNEQNENIHYGWENIHSNNSYTRYEEPMQEQQMSAISPSNSGFYSERNPLDYDHTLFDD